MAQRVDTPLDVGGNRPWALGVPRDEQQAAQALFFEGNERLRESVFVEATRNYRRALRHWNHPAIHYNLALALMNLDQPIEVYKHLKAAVGHGPEPLDSGRYEHARSYNALLEKQLAWVDVKCDEEGAIVTLNGQSLFKAPGRYQAFIRPGVHSIVAFKDGYLPTEKRQPLMPGEKAELDLELYTEDEVIRYRRQWAAWIPWTVLGAGLAAAGGGGVLHWKANGSFRDFDSRIPPGGRQMTPELEGLRRTGSRLQAGAVGAYSLGGAAVVTGTVLLYLNRQRAYRINPAEQGPTMVIAPAVDAESKGVVGTVLF
ncbi:MULTISPECIES: PEGA domain-containing protein [Myxococcus]|uniref:PEGA domain-containing protein n=1 Tax=Myxococcus TaxID=32 RepID=UPI0013D25585|nr:MULTISPECIES: PEGA domain-containing protein [Myxococcus]NVJ28098.1 PEGA domain-containing protein [Myxococcus sp. AM011]